MASGACSGVRFHMLTLLSHMPSAIFRTPQIARPNPYSPLTASCSASSKQSTDLKTLNRTFGPWLRGQQRWAQPETACWCKRYQGSYADADYTRDSCQPRHSFTHEESENIWYTMYMSVSNANTLIEDALTHFDLPATRNATTPMFTIVFGHHIASTDRNEHFKLFP